MTWVLILHFATVDGASSLQAGHMVDRQACVIAGAGMAFVLESTNPGLDVKWECHPLGAGI